MPDIRFDDGLRALVSAEPWKTAADRVGFAEGPLWLTDGALLFSDIPNSKIRIWRQAELGIYREPSNQSNGLTLDTEMRLLACEHEARRVSRERPDGTTEAIAAHYDGKRLNSPNDLVCRTDGRVYFTDPPYGITDDQRELPYNGVFTISPAGDLALLLTDFDRPNGLAFSPDERTLYIADTARHHVRAFDVAEDGALSNGRVFATMRDEGRPDGMKVDRDGRLFVCATTIQVFAADGRPLGIIDCPQLPANCAWGEDGGTLAVCARSGVYLTHVDTVGIAPHLRRTRR